MTNLSEVFLAYVLCIALLTRVWLGGNMMIHSYPKLRNMKKGIRGIEAGVGHS